MQRHEKGYIEKMNDTNEFTRNQAMLQAAHNTQMDQYEEYAKKKN